MLSKSVSTGVCRRLGARGLTTHTPHIEMTTLSNGLRVVTDSTPGHFAALGAYVDAGLRYENPQKPGLSHLMDRLAWKSSQKYSGIRMVETLASLGGNYMCAAQRESILYQASVFNKDVARMFDCIAETVRQPQISDQELSEALQTAEYEASEMAAKHDVWLPEVLHAAAYDNNTLGLPLFCPPERISSISRADMNAYHTKFFQPKHTVVAMVGVPHKQALDLAQMALGDWKNTGGNLQPAPIRYTGGEIALPYQPPLYTNLPELYHMQIGFETAGLLHDDLYALATLQKLLGGGLSFSAGGPGKGMFLRLYTHVLNQYGYVENCLAFNHLYVGLGLFGITISAVPAAAHVMPQIVCMELSQLLEKNGLTDSEVERAKNQLISSLLMNVESKLASLEDLGRQIQCQGKLTTVDEMIAKISKLTGADLQAVAKKVFLGKPAVVLQGDREAFGDVDAVLRESGLGKK